MKQLDAKRFGQVLKLDFAEGLKPMMWGALAMTLLYLFFFWFAHSIGYKDIFIEPGPDSLRLLTKMICEAVGAFSLIAMFIFFLVAASILYRSEQKKQQRIAWLMLPATNLEKFLSRWIYMVVFSLVGGMLTFFIADAIHIAYLWISRNPVMTATPFFFNTFPHQGKYDPLLNIINVYGMMITIHAFFLLGSVLFRKYHFIISGALVVLAFAVIASLYNASGLYVYNGVMARTVTDIVFIVFEVCAIVLFTWLTYRLFCRWQVVTHIFVNL
jgi:hypothetical protein